MQILLPKIQKAVFISLIVLMPFSNFFFQKIDIWHAQGFYLQFAILILFSLHIFKSNKPLGSFLFYSGLITSIYWIGTLIKYKQYAILTFLPFFNLLSIVIFYLLIITYLDDTCYEYICKSFSVITILLVAYTILQYLDMDQFFTYFNNPDQPKINYIKDQVVGIMGNQFHFASYLCLTLPFSFITKYGKVIALLSLFAIYLTGSLSNLIIALILLSFFYKEYTKREIVLFISLCLIALIYQYKHFPNFISTSSRLTIWKNYLPYFKERAISGYGFGFINAMSKNQTFLAWRHLHNEFYHYTIELGLIGLGLIIYGCLDYFKHYKHTKLSYIMGVSFLALILTSLVGFPTHLWVTGGIGMLAYSYNYRGATI